MAMSIKSLLDIAKSVASNSKCVSMKVGSVLLKDGHIVSTGTNGTPKGYINCCDYFTSRGPEHSEWSEKFEVHSELNCLLHCPVDTQGSTMVTTHSPCWNCTKHMVAAGVKEIFFAERYYRMTDEEYKMVEGFCMHQGVSFAKIKVKS